MTVTMPEIELQEDEHRYFAAGVEYPSVTRVLSATGLTDFSNVPTHLRDFVLARGKAAHMAIHYFLEGDLDEYSLSQDTLGCVESLKKFLFASDFRPYAGMIEKRVYSPVHGFAGTFDCVGELGPYGPALGDWKRGQLTGVQYQTAAYLLCVPGVFNRFALKLDPTGKCAKVKMLSARDLKDDQQTFLAALRVYKKQRRPVA